MISVLSYQHNIKSLISHALGTALMNAEFVIQTRIFEEEVINIYEKMTGILGYVRLDSSENDPYLY